MSQPPPTSQGPREDALSPGDQVLGDPGEAERHEAGVQLDPDQLTGPLEALLLMATEAVSTLDLAEAIGAPEAVTRQALAELVDFYDRTGRGFELRQVGGGWRLWTRPEHAELLSAWVLEGQHARLSQASLETLAVIAYLQPISRSRVSAVRGVNVDGVVRTLVARGLITEAETDEPTAAAQFITTDLFTERMGLGSLSDLPALAPNLPEVAELEAELADRAQLADPPDPPAAPEPVPE